MDSFIAKVKTDSLIIICNRFCANLTRKFTCHDETFPFSVLLVSLLKKIMAFESFFRQKSFFSVCKIVQITQTTQPKKGKKRIHQSIFLKL